MNLTVIVNLIQDLMPIPGKLTISVEIGGIPDRVRNDGVWCFHLGLILG